MLAALTLPPWAGIVCRCNENSAKLCKTMLSPLRIVVFTDQEREDYEAYCPHFPNCVGCPLSIVPYPEQLS